MPTFKEDLHLGHSVPTIDTEDIEDGAITEKKLADGSVSTRTIQNGAVTEPKIANRAVTEPKLADWAVSTRTVRDKAISERKLADLSVSTRTIQDKSVTNPKIADSTISMGKLDNDVQTKIQQGTQRAWTPKGAYNENTVYGVNDLVYYTDTNSSYISLQANNQGHNPAWQSATGGWWMKVVDGSYVNVMVDELEQAIAQAIEDAQEDISGLISDSQATINAAVSGANTAAQAANTAAANAEAKIDWVEKQVDSLTAYEVATALDDTSIIPVQNKVVTEAINNLSENLQDMEEIVTNKNLTFTTTAGFVGTNGTLTNGSSAGYRYTSLIPVREGQRIEVKCYTSASTLAIAAYSSDNTTTAVVASSVQGVGGLRTYTYNVPAGIAYIRVTNQANNYASPNITRIAPLTHVLDTYDDALDDISVLQHKVLDEKIALNIVNGQFVQSNGSTASNGNYQYGEFAVKAGEKYRITNSSTPNALGVAAYKQNTTAASVADSVIGAYALKTYDYVVPADIVKLRISHNKGSYPDALAVYNVSRFTEIEEEIVIERERINVAEEDIDDIQSFMYDGENKYVRENAGYVQTNGTVLYNRTSPYNYSALIPVTAGDVYEVNTAASLSVLAVAAYSAEDTTTADVSNSVIKNGIFTIRYVVPTGIAYLRITCNMVNLPSPYIKRIAPYNAKFDEIDERLGNLEGGGAKSKPISILFIGNSLTQDAISYLPWLLTTLAPEVSFKFYIWYCGGYTLAQHYSRISNNQTCETFSRCEDNTAWTNSNNSITMQYILEHYKFDIVCLQEYFNYKSSYTDADLAPFNNIISYIRANYNYPFKVATLFHQPKRDVAERVFNLTKQGNGLILQKTDAEILNPAGIAIYRAMSTDLDNLGDQGHLSPDGTHSQEGLPCILQAYVSALWIFDQLSLPRSIVNEKQRITTAIYNSLYIPGPNGSLVVGTDEQYNLAQDVAVKAWKEGKFLLNANLTEYTN